ncbi:hypothetical protein BCE_4637 [Bacillus cereus ATCC 10987]|uniref:Uncharacterized protein n=1 Tax=Bacillus cereus (strain ATCC 10987 / NRS 248) TaxID=222523 RepID=Q72ZN1_BACC1|nr:hypothetical protein BCE_4637 [Bacillus cereus ATCC 10987]
MKESMNDSKGEALYFEFTNSKLNETIWGIKSS